MKKFLFLIIILLLNTLGVMGYEFIDDSSISDKFIVYNVDNYPLWDRYVKKFNLITQDEMVRTGFYLKGNPETSMTLIRITLPEKEFDNGRGLDYLLKRTTHRLMVEDKLFPLIFEYDLSFGSNLSLEDIISNSDSKKHNFGIYYLYEEIQAAGIYKNSNKVFKITPL